jgi:spermidine synthase
MVEKTEKFKVDTAYNTMDVVVAGDRLEFRSRDDSLQSVIDLQNPHLLQLRNLEFLMAALLFIQDPERILILGTAGGSLLHFLKHHYPEAHLTALDIDIQLIEELLQRKILPAPDPGLEYIYADAADFISGCDQKYDLILVDVFSGSQSPSWLLRKESSSRLFRLLNDPGAVAYNLIIDSEHGFKGFYRDLRLVFAEQTLCLPVKDFENTIAFAFRSPQQRDMSANMRQAMNMSERLGIDLMRVLSVIYNTNPIDRGVI